MVKLSVNIDHVATVREARKIEEPEPVAAAILVEEAGAHGVTCHIRLDRRHIKERDIRLLKEVVHLPLNVELALDDDIVAIVSRIRPTTMTFVPERANELTTEGGLDVVGGKRRIQKYLPKLWRKGIRVSLFIDPVAEQVEAAKKIGVDLVELNTAKYSEAKTQKQREKAYRELATAARCVRDLGLTLAAGHGLNTKNVGPVAAIDGMEELNIGHSIVGRAIMVGMQKAVREMLAAMNEAAIDSTLREVLEEIK